MSAGRLKPGGGMCEIREQIHEDPVTNLVLWFELVDEGVRLTITPLDPGKPILEFGNRDLFFNEGIEVGAGTALTSPWQATWLRVIPAGESEGGE